MNEEEEDASISLTQQMGFSSFGAQPQPKKRKPNPVASAGSGSNELPLGKTRLARPDRKFKTGDVTHDPTLPESAVGDAGGSVMGNAGSSVVGDAGESIVRDAGERIVGDAGSVPQTRDSACDEGTVGCEGDGMREQVMMDPGYVHASQERGGRLGRDRVGGKFDWRGLRRGVRDENGDVAYYDRSFVEDPWRELREGGGRRGL